MDYAHKVRSRQHKYGEVLPNQAEANKTNAPPPDGMLTRDLVPQ